MYNFNYEYITFLYFVHVYMLCNVVLYCIALPARILFAIKIIIIIIVTKTLIVICGHQYCISHCSYSCIFFFIVLYIVCCRLNSIIGPWAKQCPGPIPSITK